MSAQIIINIDHDLKTKLTNLAKAKGKTKNQIVKDLIEKYVNQNDISAYIDDLWNRISRKLKAKGVTPAKIKEAIEKARAQ